LRQNDAVFLHVKNLGQLIEELLSNPASEPLSAIGVSVKPLDTEGSYMPCFLAGDMASRVSASCLKIPRYTFSHQAGHIAAVLYGARMLDLIGRRFLALHISGGTTQCLLVEPCNNLIMKITTLAETLDLNAGQIVDRVGGMLGLGFPSGSALEELAHKSEKTFRTKASIKGADCCLSGLENQCRSMMDQGFPREDIAAYCLSALGSAILGMTDKVTKSYPHLPLICAGGVMSNSLMRGRISKKYPNSAFAPAWYSSDNAVGAAVLASICTKRRSDL